MCAPRSDARDTSDGFSRTAHNTTIRSRPATPYATQIQGDQDALLDVNLSFGTAWSNVRAT
jgi:hypothetical protein